MEIYLFPIKIAIFSFIALSTIATWPYILFQYLKYGSVSIYRALVLFSFSLYILCAYYLVILPLPDPETFVKAADLRHYMNLLPLSFIFDFVTETTLSLTDIHTYAGALTQMVVLQPAFNILLTVPFGVYSGYYFKGSFKKTVLLTFLLSLFFEITQLSGLYGLYPYPYRLFDVDDLLLNTLGGLLGFLFYKQFLFFLPSRERIDELNIRSSEKVGYIRRVFAFGIDYYLVSLAVNIAARFYDVESSWFNIILFSFILFTYLVLSQLVFKQTIGKALVRIRLQTDNKEQHYAAAVVLRYALLCLILLLISILNLQIKTVDANGIYALLLIAILMVIFLDVLWRYKQGKTLTYERISKTRNISTIASKGQH